MSDNLHEKASDILAKIIDLPPEKASKMISELSDNDQELEKSVHELYNSIREEEVRLKEKESAHLTRKRIGSAESSVEKLGYWTQLLLADKRNRLLLMGSIFIVILVIGVLVRNQFTQRIENEAKEKLIAQVASQSNALVAWLNRERDITSALAKADVIVNLTAELDSLVEADPSYALIKQESSQIALGEALDEVRKNLELETVAIFHKRDPVSLLAAGETDSIQDNYTYLEIRGDLFDYLRKAQKSVTPTFVPPLHDSQMIANIPENMEIGTYLAYLAPVYKNGQIKGYFFNSYEADRKFSDIIRNADYGQSNKVYAFSNRQQLLSVPRDHEKLFGTYLFDHDSLGSAINRFELLDPGAPVSKEDPEALIPPIDQSFTSIIDQVMLNRELNPPNYEGVLMDPYRDYRGVEVIGAYKWLPEQEFGLIAEIDAVDAFAPIRYFDTALVLFYTILLILIAALYQLNSRFIRFGKRLKELELIGHYEVLEKIGEGGFGDVYRARHQNLRSDVAIKLLKKELNDSDALTRFEKEVRSTSQLNHPNTIKVFDFGTTEDGRFYYVMEFLHGIPLETVMNSYDEFPVNRAIYVLLHTCYALEEAHAKRLVHRDIKPANIMLCNEGGAYDHLKVLDFGLVKDLDASKTQQTQINRIGGTPMFMSPERLRDPFNTDQRVDVYSVGALGLYMLSGQYVVELISQKMLGGEATIEGDLQASIFERKDLPEKLRELLLQCVHFSVEKRPSNMKELIETLEELSKEYPWTREDASNWWKEYDVYN